MSDAQTPPTPNLEKAGELETLSKPADKSRKPRLRKSASSPKKFSPSEKTSAAEKPGKKAPPPWTFPKNTLEDSIKIARAIEEQNAGNSMKPDMLSKAVGYNSTSDWRFLDLLRSANQYGLVPGLNRPGFAGGSNFQIGWSHDEQNDEQVFP